ncbi:hypothetical protein JZ751_020058 [Albula glossodonta]|uniref:Putative sodium-coupled neutral amino acid transporter 11 n=1 Tax=Albula glossodonta TaxID=121402 RepID=A0A8T2NKE6_9TELE|nr:hypothetical protein JZ751_020058 [Albula glossodonta]
MNQAGLPLGLLLLIVVGFITDYSIILLIKGGHLSGTRSYQDLVHTTFGFPGYLILSVLQFLYPFIAMVSYNIITGDTLTKVFQRIPGVGPDHIFAKRHFIILLTTVLFTFPLSLYRDISKLGKVMSRVLTYFSIRYISLVIRPILPPTENAWSFAHWNAIQAVGVMSFAFICHHNSFLIYGSLEEPTLSNWSRVTHISVSSAMLVSLLFAAAGYATFTGYTQGDIFENYCRNDDLATFGRFCYGISIITTFPLECFVTREWACPQVTDKSDTAILSVAADVMDADWSMPLAMLMSAGASGDDLIGPSVVSSVFFKSTLSSVTHVAVTILIIVVVTAISLTYDCLGAVLELNGALSAVPLIFIIPSACHLKLSSQRWYQGENLVSFIILLLGMFVVAIGVTMTSLYPQDCSHGAEMFYCPSSNLSVTLTTPSTGLPQLQNLSQNALQFT